MSNFPIPAIRREAWRRSEVADKVAASPERAIRDFLHEQSFAFRAKNDLLLKWSRLFDTKDIFESELAERQGLGESLVKKIEELLSRVETKKSAKIFEVLAKPSWAVEKNYEMDLDLLAGLDAPRVPSLFISWKSSDPGSSEQFIPSRALIDLWADSLKALAQDAPSVSSSLVAPSEEDIKREFTKNLTGLFGTIGQQLRYEGAADTSVTRDGMFTASFEIEICDRFLILPSRAARFLALLRYELVAAIRAGALFQGAWGRIELSNDGELHYVLTPPNKIKQPGFVAAKRVE